MFLFRWPTSLWFLGGGGETGSSAAVCVSVVYQISASIGAVDEIEIDLSAQAYGLSATFLDGDESFALSVQVGIDLDDNAYGTPSTRLSVVPVFVLEQTGAETKSVDLSAQISASIVASIGYDVTPSVSYQISASISAGVEIATDICVSAVYQISASTGLILQVQLGQEDKGFTASYGMSTSITPVIVIVNRGGLVYSRKKQRYIAVRVGSVTS